MRDAPYRLRYLNTLSPIWGGLGGAALLEEIMSLVLSFKNSKLTLLQVCSLLPVCEWRIDL